ncbi:MAG: F0F1 ATP synthase subunit A [Planctomycetes bacterium]|nr:F0F1 ATP synthase subunit A [Planctomycetota bacterium]
MNLRLDERVVTSLGGIEIWTTQIFTWIIMAILVGVCWLATRRATEKLTPWQNFLEIIVEFLDGQIRQIAQRAAGPFLPFVGTLFLFIATSNLLSVVPYFDPPTGQLSTTAALAACVLVAVPWYGIASRGVGGYLKGYVEPVFIMLPFNLVGEISRTIALAVRLFGNIMSGGLIAAVLLAFVPLFIPIVIQVLGLLTGLIQAYIFAILATVYIAAGLAPRKGKASKDKTSEGTISEGKG